MIIEKLIVTNFRPFYGSQTVEVRPDKDKPLVLVKAHNDVGKTSLFKAIQFCLYGERSQDAAAKHVNRTAAAERDGIMSVRMVFSHEDSQYEFTRSVEFKKKNNHDELPRLKGPTKLEVKKDGVIEVLKGQEDENHYVESILPEDASQFFLFDGEKIQDYTTHPPKENIKEAIEMVLGIRELLNARDDLRKLKSVIRSELTKLTGEKSKDKEEAQKLKELDQEIKKDNEAIEQLKVDINQANETIKECNRQLGQYQEIRAKVEDRNKASAELAIEKSKLQAVDETLREFNSNASVLVLAPMLQSFSSTFSLAGSSYQEYEQKAASRALSRRICICNRKLDTKSKKHLQSLTTKQPRTHLHEIGDLAQQILLEFEPKSLETKLFEHIENKSKVQQQILRLEDRIKTLDKEIGQDAALLGEKIKEIGQSRKRAIDDKENYERAENQKIGEVKTKERDYDNRQRKLSSKTLDKDVKRKQLLHDTCEAAENATSEVIDKLVKSRQRDVEKLASEIFASLTNNPDLYTGIKINSSYELQVETVGKIVRNVWDQEPSSGASQVIATSFLAALNRYTAREAPVVIDTPVARLDEIHNERMVRFYPNIGAQVIILYQPRELTDKDISMVHKFISWEYEMKKDEDNPAITKIRKVRGG